MEKREFALNLKKTATKIFIYPFEMGFIKLSSYYEKGSPTRPRKSWQKMN